MVATCVKGQGSAFFLLEISSICIRRRSDQYFYGEIFNNPKQARMRTSPMRTNKGTISSTANDFTMHHL